MVTTYYLHTVLSYCYNGMHTGKGLKGLLRMQGDTNVFLPSIVVPKTPREMKKIVSATPAGTPGQRRGSKRAQSQVNGCIQL